MSHQTLRKILINRFSVQLGQIIEVGLFRAQILQILEQNRVTRARKNPSTSEKDFTQLVNSLKKRWVNNQSEANFISNIFGSATRRKLWDKNKSYAARIKCSDSKSK